MRWAAIKKLSDERQCALKRQPDGSPQCPICDGFFNLHSVIDDNSVCFSCLSNFERSLNLVRGDWDHQKTDEENLKIRALEREDHFPLWLSKKILIKAKKEAKNGPR